MKCPDCGEQAAKYGQTGAKVRRWRCHTPDCPGHPKGQNSHTFNGTPRYTQKRGSQGECPACGSTWTKQHSSGGITCNECGTFTNRNKWEKLCAERDAAA